MATRTRKRLMANGVLRYAGWLLPFLSITLNSSNLQAAPGVPPFPADQCPADRYTSKLNCTSNDVKFAGDPEASSPGTCSAGSRVVIPQLSVTVLPNSDIRYNLGLFFGEQGKDIQKLSTAGGNTTCKAYTFPTSPAPWKDLDNNICGDVDGPSNPGIQKVTYEDVELSCVPGKDGDLLAPMLISWQQPGAATQCGTDSPPYPKPGNTYAVPGTSAKCQADTTRVVGNFTTYANLRIVKDANPDSAGPFTFTVTGESGGATTTQIFGALPNPNPPPPVGSFNLTGNAGSGDSQDLYVAYGGANPSAKLTVTETGKSGYDLKSISCVLNDANGNPTSTPATFISYNSIDGILVASFDANNLSATCTYTNVKDSLSASIDKSLYNGSWTTGSTGNQYSIKVKALNNPGGANKLRMNDIIPSGVTITSINSTGKPLICTTSVPLSIVGDGITTSITCENGEGWVANDEATIYLTATVTATQGTITNTAVVLVDNGAGNFVEQGRDSAYFTLLDPTVSGVIFRDNGGGTLAGKGDGIQQSAEPNINCNGPSCNCGSTCPPANIDALKNLYVIFLDSTNIVLAIAPVCPWNSIACIPGSYTAEVLAIEGLQLYVTNLANLPILG